MFEWNKVSVSFGEKSVLRGCSIRGGDGARVALMGPSGCGKTTLLRVALGLQKPDSGSFSHDAARIAAVFQESRLLPWLTAGENVNLVLSDSPATMPEARDWLVRLGLGDASALYPRELSGGMQQRVSIARALTSAPELLILDEPFRGLDRELREEVMSLLRSLSFRSGLLLATHSEEEAGALGCRILRWRNGTFVE